MDMVYKYENTPSRAFLDSSNRYEEEISMIIPLKQGNQFNLESNIYRSINANVSVKFYETFSISNFLNKI